LRAVHPGKLDLVVPSPKPNRARPPGMGGEEASYDDKTKERRGGGKEECEGGELGEWWHGRSLELNAVQWLLSIGTKEQMGGGKEDCE